MKTILSALLLTGVLCAVAESAPEDGFVSIFDGTSLEGWQGDVADASAKDGVLVQEKGKLLTKQEYANFVFRFEFKTVKGGNNGVGIRTPVEGNPAFDGMEIQILDHDDPQYADIKPWQCHGSIYGVVAAKRASLRPEGEWNTQEIHAEGSRIKVTLNGEVIVDADIAGITETLDGRAHPGLHNKKGHLGFLGHGARFEFRNLRVKVLP